MIRLTRIFVYNWGKFDEPTLIPVGDVTLLSGANQAGKSQIIDAAMMVLTGRKKGIFNKAADKHSARNVEKYLYGYWAANNQEKFLRHEGIFTSYVVLEFKDDVKDRYFCNGFVADCPQDHTRRSERWFSYRGKGIPDNEFIFDDVVMSIGELKRYLKSYVGEENYSFYTDTEYSKYIMASYGQVRSDYIALLKAAVSCSIGENLNIGSFITDSICSVTENVDLSSIRSTIHDYYDLKDRAESSRRRIEKLEKIRESYALYHEDVELTKKLDYALIRDEEKILESQMEASTQLIEQLSMDMEQARAMNKVRSEKLTKLRDKIGHVHEELGRSDTAQIRKSLEEKKKDLDEKRKGYEDNLSAVHKTITSRAGSLIMFLMQAENAGFTVGSEYMELLDKAQNISEEALSSFDLADANEKLGELYQEIVAYHSRLGAELKEVKERQRALKEEKSALLDNKKPYPKESLAMKELLEKELSSFYHKEIKIDILADLLEIRDPEWQNAVEGYLDNQRFDLLIPSEYYDKALEIYRANKDRLRAYRSGLIDAERIRSGWKRNVEKGALSEEVVTDNEDARLYVDYKLGYIIKVDIATDLYKHKCSITRDLLIYKGFVTRGKNSVPALFIGGRAAQQQAEQIEKELAKLEEKIDEITASMTITGPGKLERYLADEDFYAAAISHAEDIRELEEESLELLRQIGSVDTTRDAELKNELAGLNARMEEVSSQMEAAGTELGRGAARIESEEKKLRIAKEEYELLEEKAMDASRFSASWRTNEGDPWIREDAGQNRRGNLKKIRDAHNKMREDALLSSQKRFSLVRRLRSLYNQEETAGFDPDREFDNEEFDTELIRLRESGFVNFEDEIARAAERATSEFKVEFIGKLKANIQQAQEQIDAVNEVLTTRWFGNVKYKLIHEKEKSYERFYDMFMDPNLVRVEPDMPGYGGISIFSGAFEEAHRQELDELLQLIMDEKNLTQEQRISREKKLEMYTDYRTYLHLDLASIDHGGSTKYMSDVIRDESGSGIQTPYYIVMFAAIAQKVRAADKENTLRIVILDEAFNKMDENKIAASIDLLRSFDLQPIFCCVPEKVKVIAPKADITDIVMMYNDKSSYVESFFDKEALAEMN
ncbi:SbcC/MukB-like Walker B domain-containing protein [Butyrivibrio sp. MC2013]|uniref:SbcC/MukB-like Walker B domain-containing protein n=1 Tax=Butyrivibrio sp. MC2013 TaxID=1280686 RepID=UPI00040A57B0|nr:SbcC/MukB-like Walker B domain-containing protein [Butyrivibrio sp. MC2013]